MSTFLTGKIYWTRIEINWWSCHIEQFRRYDLYIERLKILKYPKGFLPEDKLDKELTSKIIIHNYSDHICLGDVT